MVVVLFTGGISNSLLTLLLF